MQGRNLENIPSNNNALFITGYPVLNTPPPVNGQILTYENGDVLFQTVPAGTGVNSIQNIGTGAGVFQGTVATVASLRSLITTDPNTTVVQNSNSITINGPTSPTYTNVVASSVTSSTVNVDTLNPRTGSAINSASINTTNLTASGVVNTNTLNPVSGSDVNLNGYSLSQLKNLNPYSGNLLEIYNGISINPAINQSGRDNFVIKANPANTDNSLLIDMSDAVVSGEKSISFQGTNGGTTYPNIIQVFGNGTVKMAQLPINLNPTPNFYVSCDSTGLLSATVPSSIIDNIYTNDGTINIGNGATRTVALASYTSPQLLNIFGGFLQNNFVAITNPQSPFATNQNTMVTADTNGIFRGYSLTQTLNSARIVYDLTNLNSTTNAINFYQTTGAYNMTFNAEIHMVFNQSYNQPSYSWKLNTCYGANFNTNTWIYVQPYADSGWQQNYFLDYILEYMSPSTNPAQIILRLRKYIFATIPTGSTLAATITVVRHENDINTNGDGTYSIPTLTPYLASTAIAIPSGSSPQYYTQNIKGTGQPPTFTFSALGQRYMRISFSCGFVITTSGATVTCQIYVGGIATGIILNTVASVGNEIAYLNYTGSAVSTVSYAQSGMITSYASNSSNISLVFTGGTIVWNNKFYSLTIDLFN